MYLIPRLELWVCTGYFNPFKREQKFRSEQYRLFAYVTRNLMLERMSSFGSLSLSLSTVWPVASSMKQTNCSSDQKRHPSTSRPSDHIIELLVLVYAVTM